MAGFSWPGDLGIFQDIADKFFSDADESELRPIADEHKSLADQLPDQLYDGDDAYKELEDAYQVDGKASDALAAVQARRAEYRKRAGALAAEAQAGQAFMQPVAQIVSDSKSADAKAGYEAFKKAHETQYWPDWMLHTVGKETKVEEAKKQLEGEMSSNMKARVAKLQNTYKPPADGDYDFDGQPTTWDNGPPLDTSVYQRAEANQQVQSNPAYQQAEANQQVQSNPAYQQAEANQQMQSNPAYQQAGAQSPAGASGGGPAGAAGQGGSAGVPNAGGAATGLQSAGAAAERAAPAAAPQAAPQQGGGVGAPPSISGVGGGLAGGGGGQPARIGGIGAGGASEAPRTGMQSGGATEKPAASSSSSQGERQSAGLSRAGSGAGAGGVGGETRAQSASAAGVREAMRGDTAGGASGVGQRAEERSQTLMGSATSLSRAELVSARSVSGVLQGALSGLGARVARNHPVRDPALGELIASGGVVAGAAMGGLLPSGVWGRVPWPGSGPVEHPGLDGVGFVFADMRVAPNEAAGVSRPTTTRVTTTGAESEIEPALRLPLGTRLLDRSQAPAATEFLTNPGLLAVGLSKWLLDSGLDGDASWRLVAVCFTKDPGSDVLEALLRLQRPVEAYWPERAGYEERLTDDELRAARSAAEDARHAEEAQREELGLKGRDPLAHAKAAENKAPNEPYPAEGLPEKEAGWHAVCRENNRGALPTARRWVLELEERYKSERQGAAELRW